MLAVNDLPEGYDYPPEVRFEIEEQHLATIAGGRLPSLQHFRRRLPAARVRHLRRQGRQPHPGAPAGGPDAGRHDPAHRPDGAGPDQRRVMDELVRQSARLVVMTERGRAILQEIYGAPPAKIDLIAHGIPDTPFVDPNPYKEQFGVEGKRVLLTFGLLSPNKGIEYMLRALPEITRQYPELSTSSWGRPTRTWCAPRASATGWSLERLAAKLGMKQHVIFYNRFVELEELNEFIGAADIYVTPYLNTAQITSGTLGYAFGCGKAVVSTPYWHAEELLADGRGVLVPFADSGSIASAVNGLLRDEARLGAMCERAYLLGREMIWDHVARHYFASFRQARADHRHHHGRRFAVKTLAEQPTGTARAHARPPGAADRLDRHLPACDLHHPQLRRGVLHRRQRASSPADGPARAIAPRFAGSAAACDHLFGLPPARLRPRQPPFPELHELRSPLAGRARLRRLLRAVPLGIGRLRGAVEAPQLPEMGGRAVPAGPAGCGADDLTTNLGLCPARRSGVPRELERRSQRRRHER